MTLHINQGGTWKQVQEVFVKDAGSWKTCKDVFIKQNGVWVSTLYAAGSTNYTSAGTYSLVVPAGVYSVSATIYGAGGGSGASNSDGDAWVGGGGGAGGTTSTTVAVTPGDVLTLEVGLRGYGASYRFNGSYAYNPNNSQLGTGLNGGTTRISRNSTVLLEATGGGGGSQFGYGVGGTPGGGNGEQGPTPGYIGYGYNGPIAGGTNGSGSPPSGTYRGTGYGNGGGQAGLGVGVDGQDGAIFLSW